MVFWQLCVKSVFGLASSSCLKKSVQEHLQEPWWYVDANGVRQENRQRWEFGHSASPRKTCFGVFNLLTALTENGESFIFKKLTRCKSIAPCALHRRKMKQGLLSPGDVENLGEQAEWRVGTGGGW